MALTEKGVPINLRPVEPGGTQGQIGWCATCTAETITMAPSSHWVPGVVRVTFKCRGYAGSISVTFCRDCIPKLEESDFEALEDWVWRGWRRAALLANMPAARWEEKVKLYSEFKILHMMPEAERTNEDGEWVKIPLEEARARIGD